MRTLALSALLASSAALAACATVPPPVAANSVCGTYGYVDINNDGQITGTEWNTYRTSTYDFWDTNRDGRISQAEFANCWRAGGFYRDAYYSPDYWNHYWSAFDANADGYLSADEYWSGTAWSRVDRNGNGIMDTNEYMWWGS